MLRYNEQRLHCYQVAHYYYSAQECHAMHAQVHTCTRDSILAHQIASTTQLYNSVSAHHQCSANCVLHAWTLTCTTLSSRPYSAPAPVAAPNAMPVKVGLISADMIIPVKPAAAALYAII
eukprot:12881-Heterococcus_DN1.PRE.2